ncbi:pentatricopeptide repeat (PPR) superfamily protein [Striga asiatica]|uniref:Pentatricopeptide repeat (PPR) superfamily protein n=1 Tax=Striga asiatica TaxID=4170 RepID=A0A5A7RK32_STRAF|nr:pentatricopeptide repeat (PPR) superfamily protein [Striga asiatica]
MKIFFITKSFSGSSHKIMRHIVPRHCIIFKHHRKLPEEQTEQDQDHFVQLLFVQNLAQDEIHCCFPDLDRFAKDGILLRFLLVNFLDSKTEGSDQAELFRLGLVSILSSEVRQRSVELRLHVSHHVASVSKHFEERASSHVVPPVFHASGVHLHAYAIGPAVGELAALVGHFDKAMAGDVRSHTKVPKLRKRQVSTNKKTTTAFSSSLALEGFDLSVDVVDDLLERGLAVLLEVPQLRDHITAARVVLLHLHQGSGHSLVYLWAPLCPEPTQLLVILELALQYMK